jgi:hypothetical protein
MAKTDGKTEGAHSLQWLVGAAILLGALLSFLPLGAGAADEQPVKVKYAHGSGVNPRHFERWECTLDTRSMKTDDAAKLSSLINSTKILSTKDSEYETTDGGPFYLIEIEKAQQKRTFNWSYQHSPAAIQPLVRFLEDHSKKTVYENGKEVK